MKTTNATPFTATRALRGDVGSGPAMRCAA